MAILAVVDRKKDPTAPPLRYTHQAAAHWACQPVISRLCCPLCAQFPCRDSQQSCVKPLPPTPTPPTLQPHPLTSCVWDSRTFSVCSPLFQWTGFVRTHTHAHAHFVFTSLTVGFSQKWVRGYNVNYTHKTGWVIISVFDWLSTVAVWHSSKVL